MDERQPIETAPLDGTEIIVGDEPPAWEDGVRWEHRVRWERNGWAISRQRFAENPTYWRPIDPPATEPTSPFPEFENSRAYLIATSTRLTRELEEARTALRRIVSLGEKNVLKYAQQIARDALKIGKTRCR